MQCRSELTIFFQLASQKFRWNNYVLCFPIQSRISWGGGGGWSTARHVMYVLCFFYMYICIICDSLQAYVSYCNWVIHFTLARYLQIPTSPTRIILVLSDEVHYIFLSECLELIRSLLHQFMD